jgi:hypothetical protein
MSDRAKLGIVKLSEIRLEKGYTARSKLWISGHFHAAPMSWEGKIQ